MQGQGWASVIRTERSRAGFLALWRLLRSCKRTDNVPGGESPGIFSKTHPYGPSRNQQLADHRRKHGGQGRQGELVLPPRTRNRRWQARPNAQRVRTHGRQCCVTARSTVTQDSAADPVRLGPCGARGPGDRDGNGIRRDKHRRVQIESSNLETQPTSEIEVGLTHGPLIPCLQRRYYLCK